MNHTARRIVETLACERRYGIADAKGAEYSGAGSTYKETGADTLHNFKSVAERTGCTPEQTLMTYLLKHIDSINTAVKEAAAVAKGPGADLNRYRREVYAKGEGIVSRLDDARNYLDLLECLLIDLSHIGNPYHERPEELDEFDVDLYEPILQHKPVEVTTAPNAVSRRLPDTQPEGLEYLTEGIIGFDGVMRPRSAPEGTEIIPPLCWGETGE